MTSNPVYRTDDGENFVLLAKFQYQKKTYVVILNILDECFSDNDLIRFPTIEAKDAHTLKSSIKKIGYITSKSIQSIFWPAFYRMQETMVDRLNSDIDTMLFKALDQSLSLANSEPSNSDLASY